jgi:hypothetical protein
MKSHLYVVLLAGVLLAMGIIAWWSIASADRGMRSELLKQAQLAANTIQTENILALTGSPADLDTPEYQRLKQFLGDVQKTDRHYRFSYLLGRKGDGSIVFFVDAEPGDSPDYAPPESHTPKPQRLCGECSKARLRL